MNKTSIISVVVVLALVVGGYYFYTNMNSDQTDVKSEMQSVIKSDSAKENSTQPDDISDSVDNVDMAELDAQISADHGKFLVDLPAILKP
jgi:flagellar basal body-associated protein FliL